MYSNKVEDYLKDAYYFHDIEEIINDEDINMFSEINFEYFNLEKEFRNFVLRYSISHDHITESVLDDIVKRHIEYILHRKKMTMMKQTVKTVIAKIEKLLIMKN